jgi:hypothetical protein
MLVLQLFLKSSYFLLVSFYLLLSLSLYSFDVKFAAHLNSRFSQLAHSHAFSDIDPQLCLKLLDLGTFHAHLEGGYLILFVVDLIFKILNFSSEVNDHQSVFVDILFGFTSTGGYVC